MADIPFPPEVDSLHFSWTHVGPKKRRSPREGHPFSPKGSNAVGKNERRPLLGCHTSHGASTFFSASDSQKRKAGRPHAGLQRQAALQSAQGAAVAGEGAKHLASETN